MTFGVGSPVILHSSTVVSPTNTAVSFNGSTTNGGSPTKEGKIFDC